MDQQGEQGDNRRYGDEALPLDPIPTARYRPTRQRRMTVGLRDSLFLGINLARFLEFRIGAAVFTM
jgi:hypothetical protein